MNKEWIDSAGMALICVDSYEDGVLKGRICHPSGEPERFGSLSQVLLRMDRMLDAAGAPQSYTVPRAFAQTAAQVLPVETGSLPRGALSTFGLRVLFRQHASWQGEIVWLEKGARQSFRSVLELVFLMDSVLRSDDGAAK